MDALLRDGNGSHPIGAKGSCGRGRSGYSSEGAYNGGESEQDFEPYGVGYVEMPGGREVESRLTIAIPSASSSACAHVTTSCRTARWRAKSRSSLSPFAPVEPMPTWRHA